MPGNQPEGKKDDKKAATPKQGDDSSDPVLTLFFTKLDILTQDANDRAAATDAILKTISSKFDKFSDGFKEFEEEVAQIKHEVISEKRGSRRQDAKISDLEMKLEIMERDARRSNIVLEGVPEGKEQSLIEILQDLLSDLQVNIDTSGCDKIFRRGKRPAAKDNVTSTPRPIVVVFLRLSYKVQVFKNLRNLAGIAHWNNIYLNDDFTPMQKTQNNELRAISPLAKRKGFDSKVRGNTLLIDGHRYSYCDVSKLPDGLSIVAAKMFPVDNNKGIGFQSKHSVFSNMSECDLVYDSFNFNSAEELYQYRKAKECGSREDVQDVLVTDNVQAAKSIGSKIKETANWHRKKVQVMKEILELKTEREAGRIW